MDRSLIERLARECIAEDWDDHLPGYYRDMDLGRFAALVAEECAKVCDQEAASSRATHEATGLLPSAYVARGKEECSEAIRRQFALDSRQPSPSPTTD